MSMNFGVNNGYGMTGGMMGMQQNLQNNNVFQSFKAKYGCDDCYKHAPYWHEYPKPVMFVPKEAIRPNILERLKLAILGG